MWVRRKRIRLRLAGGGLFRRQLFLLGNYPGNPEHYFYRVLQLQMHAVFQSRTKRGSNTKTIILSTQQQINTFTYYPSANLSRRDLKSF